jgi:hypothetical protein
MVGHDFLLLDVQASFALLCARFAGIFVYGMHRRAENT